MATRKELETLIFYVLGEENRQLLIKSGLEGIPKEHRVAAMRGIQDLGWIGHGGMADFEESYSLTKEGRRIIAECPDIKSLERNTLNQVEVLRAVDGSVNGPKKEGLKKLIAIECEMGNWDSALVNCYELKRIAERTKDMESLAFSLYQQGNVEIAQNKWEEALESFLGAMERYMDCGDRKGVAMTNRSLGVVYGNKGDHASAMRCFESSLAMARAIGDRGLEAMAEGNLAIIYDLEGRTEESERATKRALEYFLDVGDNARAARASNNLGVLNLSRERFDAAAEYFEKTIASSRLLKSRDLLGISLVNAGYCYSRTGDLHRAITYSDEAVSIFKEPHNNNMLALAYRNYGYVEFRNSNLDKAVEWFEKSVRAADASGVEDTLAACCYEYGMALTKAMLNPRLAAKLLKKSSRIYRAIGNIERARAAESRLAAA